MFGMLPTLYDASGCGIVHVFPLRVASMRMWSLLPFSCALLASASTLETTAAKSDLSVMLFAVTEYSPVTGPGTPPAAYRLPCQG